ncbi:MAG TPA: DUF1844 domain-containing protein [Thermoleophilia bacterium]|nr:DUF1844 domain-containing protein [Thermoleophilia bacterium]
MAEEQSQDELIRRQFIGFISLMANSAMQQLGKLANPFTGKIERNLPGAKATIDMIAMLQTKTKGNLSPEEQQVLDINLSNLRLNYVDEFKRKDAPTSTPAAAAGSDEKTGPDKEGE